MKIGILLISSRRNVGGSYQYSLGVIKALKRLTGHEFYIFYSEPDFLKSGYESQNWKTVFVGQSDNFIRRGLRKLAGLFGRRIFNEYGEIKNCDPDLLIEPGSTMVGSLLKIPYVAVIHDLMHRYYPAFPEYSRGVRIIRDLAYKTAANKSLMVIVDSEQGKTDLKRFYGVNEDKVRVIPYLPSPSVYQYRQMELARAQELLAKYSLPPSFIFYPAQFWHHKNHLRLIRALDEIRRQKNTTIPLVLAGSKKESFEEAMSLARRLKIDGQIFYLGYVTDEEIVALYKKSTALVFPSLLGPTNIPPLEAMILGTPVVCSNLFEMPKQIGDAGLLFDPFSASDMAEKIYRIWTDEKLRAGLVCKGFGQTRDITMENYAKKWENIIKESLNSISNGNRN